MNVNTVKANIATALKAVTLFDNRCYGSIPDKITAPAAFVDLAEWRPDDDFAGSDSASFNVLVIGSAQNRLQAQEQLYGLCGSTTSSEHVAAAIDADPTLSGSVDWARVTRIGPVQMVSFGDVEFPSLEVEIEVAG